MGPPLIVRHWIAATPEQVWSAYMSPEQFHRFFAPEGLDIPLDSVVIEPVVGGRFELAMVFPDGMRNDLAGTLTLVEEPHHFAFAVPDMQIVSTQEFRTDGGGTLIEIIQSGLPDEVVSDPQVLEAFRSTFRKLGEVLGVVTEARESS